LLTINSIVASATESSDWARSKKALLEY